MATYSINISTPTETTKVQDLQTFLNKLPDNTAQLISPRDTRDAIFTTWENILIKETSVSGSSIGYIGLDNNALKSAMLIGKKSYTTQETLDNTLLNSDTDLFIFNGKSDSNPSLQDTKISLLAGTIPSDYYLAPYIEATKITSPSRIDLSIVNPATAGVIEINADQIELGNNGWIINNTGALYPTVDGQDLGATPSNRIGNLYMASRIDYANDLQWTFGSTTNMVLTTGGVLSIDTISASNVYADSLQITTTATAGYVLSSDGIGNAQWLPSSVVSPGVTAGYIIVADGSGDTVWQSNAASSAGSDGSIQFSQTGLLSSDSSNFFWDNSNKRMGLSTNTPSVELDVVGSGSFSSNLTVGGTANISNIIVNNISTSSININSDIIFATAGYGSNKVLTSDSFGNATWELPVVATGSDGTVQLSDGLGFLKYDDNLKWNTDYSSNYLEIGQPSVITSPHGNGIKVNGNVLIDGGEENTISFNSYYDGSVHRRTSFGYSSWLNLASTGALTFNLDTDGGVANSTISSISKLLFHNGNLGIDTPSTPTNKLHVEGDIRLKVLTTPPTFITDGVIYYDNFQKDLMSYDSSDGGWFKTMNRQLFSISAENMFSDAGLFDGLNCDETDISIFQSRWSLRRYKDNKDYVSQFNFTLPDNYITGRDIELKIDFTLLKFGGGNPSLRWKAGLTSGTYYSGETNTEYVNAFYFLSGSIFYNPLKSTFLFDGSLLAPGDPVSIVIIRDNSDTWTSGVYLAHAELKMV